MSPFHGLLDVRCISCDRWGAHCCTSCLNTALGSPAHDTLDGVPLLALGTYRGPLRDVIRAIKFSGARSLIGLLGPSIETIGARFAGAVAIPVPSSRAGLVSRGFHLTRRIAFLTGLETATVLHLDDRGTQRGRRRSERLRDRSVHVVPNSLAPGCRVVLVDDVVTTGSTLSAAMKACRNHGLSVVGAIVLAATPSRRTRRDALPNRAVRV